ncbi:RNA binding Pelota-like protein [Nocardioides sp. J9]|uniref:cysteine protease StiP family protein n=1 Tax=Nocardioides sp. J9 TaxID=935844 RepID=UPI0011A495B2|nr:cysteine protease StiP family protein [Nocardioides sp. J9]TWH00064.1 RNA binding Pelota-like protein [Nocardioides sp. J9]
MTTTGAAPAAPARFGSYPPEDVTWLLSDLSDVALERSTEERERAIQGGTHYSEMLPVEFQPDAAYLELFHEALETSAERVATAVGVVGELLWQRHAARGHQPVLVSLARAGTPIGVLLRRWLAEAHDADVAHYTISIIRGRGIDEVALAHVLDRHPAGAVAFVDGWTGKGAIQRELDEAVGGWVAAHPEHADLDPELAVLADPGGCTSVHGTRDDFLIPSACLNSTVSGLISRTVYRDDLIGEGMFHGAKFYAEWADEDVSNLFVDTVAARFGDVRDAVAAGLATDPATRAVTWAGLRSVEQVARAYGITDVNLAKPGVGETTRVLLRRVPWQVLVRPDRLADLRHVLALAEARDVPVVPTPDLPYSCIGLIRQVT